MPIDPSAPQASAPPPRSPAGSAAASPAGGDPSLAVTAMLAEYNSLRQESLSSIGNRVTIANFSFGAVSLILAALISQGTASLLTGVLALALVPQIAKVGLMIWLGEYNRSQRAGKWISELERRINAAVGVDHAVSWESALLGNSIHMSYPYLSVVMLLVGVGWASIAYGATVLIELLDRSGYSAAGLGIAAAVAIAVVAVEVWYLRLFMNKWRKIKREYSKDGPPIWVV